MELIALSSGLWAAIGTVVGTIILIAPALLYAFVVFDRWIGDGESYTRVIAEVEPPDPVR